MSSGVVTYKYPTDIDKSKYKDRKLTIKVVKPDTTSDAGIALNNALEREKGLAKDAKRLGDKVPALKTIMDTLMTNKEAKLVGDTEAVIVLPLPNTFTDQQSHEWSNETSPIGTIVKGFSETKIFGGTLSLDTGLGWAASHVGARKPVADPGYYQNYTGSGPRTFSMAFDFIPNNADEAAEIIKIIIRLKQYSSPSRLVGGVALMAPYYFDISISNDYVKAMAKLDYCVLSNIAVDYGADGAMQQTNDGFPKHITLALTWQELHMTTMEDYDTLPSTSQKGSEIKNTTVAGAK